MKSPETEKISNDLVAIGERFAGLRFEPVAKGNQDVRSVSWRCKAIANANLLRGEELLRFAILAVNEHAIITAHVLTRALDETLAAIVGSRVKIEAANAARNEKRLATTLNKLTCGSQYMVNTRPDFPKPYGVGKLVAETAEFLDGLVDLPPEIAPGEFGRNYGFVSEFVHPSIGSFSVYQKFEGAQIIFDRALGSRVDPIPQLLVTLRMSGHFILAEAQKLASILDLPTEWPTKA